MAAGVTEREIWSWASGTTLVNPELVVEIKRIAGVSRHELPPDPSRIFG